MSQLFCPRGHCSAAAAALAAAAGHEDGTVRLWRIDTGTHIVLGPDSHTNTVCCLAPAHTAKGDELLLSGSYDGWVALWETKQLKGVKPHMLARYI